MTTISLNGAEVGKSLKGLTDARFQEMTDSTDRGTRTACTAIVVQQW